MDESRHKRATRKRGLGIALLIVGTAAGATALILLFGSGLRDSVGFVLLAFVFVGLVGGSYLLVATPQTVDTKSVIVWSAPGLIVTAIGGVVALQQIISLPLGAATAVVGVLWSVAGAIAPLTSTAASISCWRSRAPSHLAAGAGSPRCLTRLQPTAGVRSSAAAAET